MELTFDELDALFKRERLNAAALERMQTKLNNYVSEYEQTIDRLGREVAELQARLDAELTIRKQLEETTKTPEPVGRFTQKHIKTFNVNDVDYIFIIEDPACPPNHIIVTAKADWDRLLKMAIDDYKLAKRRWNGTHIVPLTEDEEKEE